MKFTIKFYAVLMAFFMIAVNSNAQSSEGVEVAMDKIIEKYEETQDVNCISLTKGLMLEVIKKKFSGEFGKDFMKGVRKMSIIEYSDASKETCMAIRKDLDTFTSLLKEFDLSGEKKFSNNSFVRCFALNADDSSLSDFLIAMEDEEAKMVLYMAGVIKIQ